MLLSFKRILESKVVFFYFPHILLSKKIYKHGDLPVGNDMHNSDIQFVVKIEKTSPVIFERIRSLWKKRSFECVPCIMFWVSLRTTAVYRSTSEIRKSNFRPALFALSSWKLPDFHCQKSCIYSQNECLLIYMCRVDLGGC